MKSKVAIIIVTYNKLSYNVGCIESIRKFTEPRDYELIVVDNDSTDGTREWLMEQEDIKVILNEANEGFIGGCNRGIKEAGTESEILLLNNDTVVTPMWLDNLKECLYSSEKIGVVGPMTNVTINEQLVPKSYNTIDEMIEFARGFNTSKGQDWEEKIFLMGFCILIKRKAFNKAGLYLDKLYSPGYFEDNDLCVRINQQGYKAYLCRNTFIHHYGSITFKEVDKVNQLIEDSRWKFAEKWGFDSATEPTVRGDLISNVYEPAYKELNILEVNCGLGCDLLKLKYLFPNTKLFGIEKSERRASVSGKFTNISTKDFEDLTNKYPGVIFDYVILRDVLENYRELDELIKSVRKHLKEDGYIVAEVRNILHFLVIRELINESTTKDNGNNSYINYYTKEEFINLFKKNGFENVSLQTDMIYGSDEDHRFIGNLANYSIDKDVNKYLVYKYIGKFKKVI